MGKDRLSVHALCICLFMRWGTDLIDEPQTGFVVEVCQAHRWGDEICKRDNQSLPLFAVTLERKWTHCQRCF